MEQLERELKELIVRTLELEDVAPEQIDSEAPLFDGGLGLDSIDALELGVAIKRQYKLKLEGPTKELRPHFASVRKLAALIERLRNGSAA